MMYKNQIENSMREHRIMQKTLKHWNRTTPKEYGILLQGKRRKKK